MASRWTRFWVNCWTSQFIIWCNSLRKQILSSERSLQGDQHLTFYAQSTDCEGPQSEATVRVNFLPSSFWSCRFCKENFPNYDVLSVSLRESWKDLEATTEFTLACICTDYRKSILFLSESVEQQLSISLIMRNVQQTKSYNFQF